VPSTGDLHSYLQPRAGSPTSVHHKVVSHDATIRHKNKSTRLADGNEDSAAACQARPGSHDAARAGALGARPLERPGVALLAVSGRRGALGRQAGALAGGRALRRSGAAESQLLSTRRGEMGGQALIWWKLWQRGCADTRLCPCAGDAARAAQGAWP